MSSSSLPETEESPLTGIHVLELAEGVAGPCATAFLADLGAEVAKVETPEGDPARQLAGFDAFNRQKRSFSCDLSQSSEREALALAARAADIVLIDEAWLRKLRLADIEPADLVNGGAAVLCTVPNLSGGSDDEWLPVSEDALSAGAGLMGFQSGYEEGPTRYVFPALGVFTGMLAAAGSVSGLISRARFGGTPRVEVPAVAVSALLVGLVGARLEKSAPGDAARWRSPLGQHQSYRCLRASDGWLCVTCTSPDFYNRFCIALELHDLLADPRFENAPWAVPQKHQAAQGEAFETRIAEKTVAEWCEIFEEFDVPAQPVQTLDTFLDSEIIEANNLLVPAGDLSLMRFPGEVGGFQQNVSAPAPEHGASGSIAELVSGENRWQERSPEPGPEGPRPAPLEGMQVVDFTTYLAGPICATLLGDLGADVVKVEPPGGEGLRSSGLSCLGINRGKRGLALDIHNPAGAKYTGELLSRSDIVLTGFRPGVDERLGLDAASLAARNAQIVHCSFDGYGEAESYNQRPSFDPLIQALSGQMLLQGQREGQPVFFLISLNDFGAGFVGLLALLTEVLRRESSGEGSTSRITQSGVALHLIGEWIAARSRGEDAPIADPRGRDALHRLYQTQDDRWVYMHTGEGVSTNEVLGRLNLKLDAEAAADTTTRGVFAKAIAARIAALTAEEIGELSDAGIAFVPTGVPFPLAPDAPIFASSNLSWRTSHPFFGELVSVARILRVSGADAPLQAGPWIGEHTREILESLGAKRDEIDTLFEDGVATSPVPEFAASRRDKKA